MAYGKGKNTKAAKRVMSLGTGPTPAGLRDLHERCIAVLNRMADAFWPANPLEPRPDFAAADRALLAIQKAVRADGLMSFWAERMRLLAKPALMEQWKRVQRVAYGKALNIDALGDKPMRDGHLRRINLSEAWSRKLTDADVAEIKAVVTGKTFPEVIALLRRLTDGDDGPFGPDQADALRDMLAGVIARFKKPEWGPDSVLQIHLDPRGLRGGAGALLDALAALRAGIPSGTARVRLMLLPAVRGDAPIALDAAIIRPLADRLLASTGVRPDLSSLAVEIGRSRYEVKGVMVTRPEIPSPVGATVVVGEDFGYVNTSSLVVLRSPDGVTQERLDFAASKPGKTEVKAFLTSHASGDEVEVLERVQIKGRAFLDRIKVLAGKVDGLRSQIDLHYNRLGRVRREMNVIAGLPLDALVPQDLTRVTLVDSEQARYATMHRRFFKIMAAIGRLKDARRDVYRVVAAVKKAWFGFVSNRKAALAEKHGAVVVREDLTVLAVPVEDPAYKGRTFNKMLNNGAKGQYIRRSDSKLSWKGIGQVILPSYYTSTTDWRTGHVDKRQRGGEVFTAKDGTRWDADLHASEMIGRWLFLKPKPVTASQHL